MKKFILCLCFISSSIFATENYPFFDLKDMVEWKIEVLESEMKWIDEDGLIDRYKFIKAQIDAYQDVLDMINMDDDLGPWDW